MTDTGMLTKYRFYRRQGISHADTAEILKVTPASLSQYVHQQTELATKHGKLPRPIVDGQAVCSKCNKAKPVGDFYQNKARKSGIEYDCKDCRNPGANRRDRNRPDYTPAMQELYDRLGHAKAKAQLLDTEAKARTLRAIVKAAEKLNPDLK